MKHEYLDELKVNAKLSVQKLRNHVNQHHPKKIDLELDAHEKWSICENVGKLLTLSCWVKRKVPRYAKSIGLGPALYLLTLKSYIKLFFFISILSIPSCLILASGDRSEQVDLGGGFSELFATVTLGNIGDYGSIACGSDNIAQLNKKISITCPSGKLSRIISVGLNADKDQDVCQDAARIQQSEASLDADGNLITNPDTPASSTIYNYVSFNEACSTYLSEDLINSESIQGVQEQFDLKCKDHIQCTVDYDYLPVSSKCLDVVLERAYSSKYPDLHEQIDPTTARTENFDAFSSYNYDPATPEPIIYLMAFCDNQELKIKGLDLTLTKLQLSKFLIVSDIVILTIILLGYNVIQFQQKDFVRQFQSQSVEVRDFTLVIDNLPETFGQYNDELSLKFAIWRQIQQKLRKCKELGKCPPNVNPAIVDINVVYADIDCINQQRSICRILEQIEAKHAELVFEQQTAKRFIKMEKEAQVKAKVLELVTKLQKEVEIFKIKYGEEMGLQKVEVKPEEEKEIDEMKVKDKAKTFHQNINKVYVTFACMKTKNLVERLFWKNKYSKILRVGQLCQKDQMIEVEAENQGGRLFPGGMGSLYLMENPNQQQVYYLEDFEDKPDDPVKVQTARSDPHYMKWHNMNVTPSNRVLRWIASLFGLAAVVGIAILSVNLFLSSYMPNHFDKSNIFFNKSYNCREEVTAQEVVKNELLPEARREDGLSLCFCRQQYNSAALSFFDIDLNSTLAELVADGEVPDSDKGTVIPNYCQIWFEQYLYNKALAYGPSLIVVLLNNVLGYPYIVLASKFLKLQSRDSQTFSKFILASLLWTSTIGFFLVFSLSSRDDFAAYEPEWYLSVAATIGFALFQVFFPYYVAYIGLFLFRMGKRWVDRGLSCSIYRVTDPEKWDRKDSKAEEEGSETNDQADEVRSQQKAQTKLNELYTGDRFDGGFSMAQVMTVIFVSLMYSGGMPLLYPICLLVLVVVYWYSKFMLTKFCQTNQEFNEGHVITSYKFLSLAFLAHLVVTLQMYLNSKTLTEAEQSPDDFDNSGDGRLVLSAESSPKQLEESPKFIRLYISFFTIVVCLYLVNLFLINPVTCFFQEGCCYTRKSNNLEKSSKSRRAKRYLEKQRLKVQGSHGNEIELANNIDKFSNNPLSLGQDLSLSDYSSIQSTHSKASRQEVIQYQLNLENWRQTLTDQYNNLDTTSMKVSSTNYFQEISFESLQFLYESTIEQIIQSVKRLNFYFRVAGINKDSKMGKIFLKKYDEFKEYHQSLVKNKRKVEREIDFYCEYIEKHVDFLDKKYLHFMDVPQRDLFREDSSEKPRESLDKEIASQGVEDSHDKEDGSDMQVEMGERNEMYRSEQSRGEVKFAANDDTQVLKQSRLSVMKQSLTFRIHDETGKSQVIHVENIDNQDVRSINKIKQEDEDKERDVKLRSLPYMHKLQYLVQNFDETWLRHNYLPRKLRCTSQSQTYNIQGNLKRYFGTSCQVVSPIASENVKHIIKRAEMIITDPFLGEVLNTEQERKEKEWQAKLEKAGLSSGRRATQGPLVAEDVENPSIQN